MNQSTKTLIVLFVTCNVLAMVAEFVLSGLGVSEGIRVLVTSVLLAIPLAYTLYTLRAKRS